MLPLVEVLVLATMVMVMDRVGGATEVNPVMDLEWVPATVVEVPVGLVAATDQVWAATEVNPAMDLERDRDWVVHPVLAFVQLLLVVVTAGEVVRAAVRAVGVMDPGGEEAKAWALETLALVATVLVVAVAKVWAQETLALVVMVVAMEEVKDRVLELVVQVMAC